MFIFKHLHTVVGDETYKMAVELDKYLTKNKDKVSMSYQAPHLFNLWLPETDSNSAQLIPTTDDFTFEQLNFAESYFPKTTPGFCAFELMDFYIRISDFVKVKENRTILQKQFEEEQSMVGGRDAAVTVRQSYKNKALRAFIKTSTSRNASNKSKSNKNKSNRISRYVRTRKIQKNLLESIQNKLNKFTSSNKKLFFDKEGEFYYSEKSGIPVIFLKNNGEKEEDNDEESEQEL
jgi:hypothetical protein